MNIDSAHDGLSCSPEDTDALGAALGESCRGGEVLVLNGELGTGKTVLVRGLARGLGVADLREVRSPSYTLMNRYEGRLALNHFDVYFTSTFTDLERSGLSERLEAGEVAVVEWGDRFERDLPGDRLEIWLDHRGPQVRHVRLTALGPGARRLLEAAEGRISLRTGGEAEPGGGAAR